MCVYISLYNFWIQLVSNTQFISYRNKECHGYDFHNKVTLNIIIYFLLYLFKCNQIYFESNSKNRSFCVIKSILFRTRISKYKNHTIWLIEWLHSINRSSIHNLTIINTDVYYISSQVLTRTIELLRPYKFMVCRCLCERIRDIA